MIRPSYRHCVFAAAAALFFLQLACGSSGYLSGAAGSLPSRINESSGLVSSMKGDFFWTHNDSGDVARIFAIDRRGRLLGEVKVEGALNSDWEAITADGKGKLLIGDIGNNANMRRDLAIYVIPEPDPSATQVSIERKLHFRYPDQRSFPDREQMNFDAEALFWWKDRLFLLTKHRSDLNTVLYVFPESLEEQPFDLIRVSERTLDAMVTDAALSPDGKFLAILTYTGIEIFASPEEGYDFLGRHVKTIAFHTNVTMQCEGLAWTDDSLYMTNEQRALHRLYRPMDTRFTSYP